MPFCFFSQSCSASPMHAQTHTHTHTHTHRTSTSFLFFFFFCLEHSELFDRVERCLACACFLTCAVLLCSAPYSRSAGAAFFFFLQGLALFLLSLVMFAGKKNRRASFFYYYLSSSLPAPGEHEIACCLTYFCFHFPSRTVLLFLSAGRERFFFFPSPLPSYILLLG